jgi:retinol dehydrogenase 14
MVNKTVLITGSTDGIGKQTATELASLGFNIIIHGKDESRVNKTRDSLKIQKPELQIDGFVCDLSSLSNVRNFAEIIKSRYERLDCLINNAGVYCSNRQLTLDGFEMTFAVNHLAHFLLTNLLIDQIKQSDDGRIINVSSIAHQNAMLEWDNLNAEKYFDAYSSYALSKFANILFTKELAEWLNDTTVTTNALHPGVISTKLLMAGFSITGDSLKKGAQTSVHLATSDKVKKITGEYFVDSAISRSHPLTYDKNIFRKFWKISEELVGL